MSSMSVTPKKNLMLFSGRAHPELAEQVAKHLDVTVTPQSAYSFANGEIFVRFEESVRGCDAFVLQAHCAPINDQIMEQLIMVDALKRASAKRITVVMPFWGYARQDKKHRGREPISARLIADMFKVAGADRIMTVDLHTAQIQGFFDGPVDHLFALPVLAAHVKQTYPGQSLAVVSPDSGRVRLAERWVGLAGRHLAGVHPQDPRPAPAERGRREPGRRRGRGPAVRRHRRHDRHRRHGGEDRRDPAARRRLGRDRRRDARHPLRLGVGAAGRAAGPARSSSPTRCRSRTRSASRR